MADELQIDDLLDQWEDLRESGVKVSFVAFIARCCPDASAEVIADLRCKIDAVESMNEFLDREQVQSEYVSENRAGEKPNRREFHLIPPTPGLEPIAGYRLLSKLGSGGCGEVWKASGPGGVHLALKFVQLEGRIGDAELRSLEVVKHVRHPNLLSVYGTWQVDGYLIIAMELADQTLLDRYQQAVGKGLDGIPREELLEYFSEAAKGIDYLNQPADCGKLGIQNRDIKPQNLLLSGGSVKVDDFGLARSLQSDMTGHSGSVTLAYAAPECLNGTTSNHTDQYSLAVSYCQLRGGRMPFSGSHVELIEGHRKKTPDLSMLPREERRAVARALAKSPQQRWPSCSTFVQKLREASSSADSRSSSSSWKHALDSVFADRAKSVVAISCLSAILLVGVIAFVYQLRNDASETNRHSPANAQVVRDITATQNIRDVSAQGAENPAITIAVLEFENHSNSPDLEGFRMGFRDMLATDLSHVSAIKVLERSRLSTLLAEHKLASSPFIDPASAVRLGRGLSVKNMLTGSYVISGDEIRIDVRLISTETGEILLADSVIGKKGDMFGLQRKLAQCVLEGLNVATTTAEQKAMDVPQTGDFNAFRLYGEARLARSTGKHQEAEQRLQNALERDPNFRLALRELDRLEDETILRLTEDQKRQTATVGKTGEVLRRHWEKHQANVRADNRDASYFTSLLVLSAHAGLLGDTEKERRVLIEFWERFAQTIPPEAAAAVVGEINTNIIEEGAFFYRVVDSGKHYPDGVPAPGQKEKDVFLRAELRKSYSWPHYSAMWPFDSGLRFTFFRSMKGKPNDDWLESRLPSYPHDYLRKIFHGIWGERDRTRRRANCHLLLTVMRYYARLDDMPDTLTEDLGEKQHTLLYFLDDISAQTFKSTLLKEAIPVLELLATTETDPDERRLANKVLLRFVQQLKIDEQQPPNTTTKDNAVEFTSIRLNGSPVVFVWHVDAVSPAPGRHKIDNFLLSELSDTVRSMPEDTELNLFWVGAPHDDQSHSLFKKALPAISGNKQSALAALTQIPKRSFKSNHRPLGIIVEQIIGEIGPNTDIVVIVPHGSERRMQLKRKTIDFVSRIERTPRVHVVTSVKADILGELAATTGGTAVLLTLKDPTFGEVEFAPWDISNLKPK